MAKPTTNQVAFSGNLTANGIEALIRELARARADMDPPVPEERPSVLSEADTLNQTEPLFAIAALADGGLRFWLRHEGIGWLALSLTAKDAANLRALLSEEISDAPNLQ